METYWQSDGQLPHLVNIQFRRKTTVSDVKVYTDFKLDESYTPSKISVRCGTNFMLSAGNWESSTNTSGTEQPSQNSSSSVTASQRFLKVCGS